MKLLAVFGLALAVAAIDMPTSGNPKLLTRRPQSSFKANSNNHFTCLKALSKIFSCDISEAMGPKLVFSRVGSCLETGRVLLPKNLLEMDAVHVAAFIFMFRVRGGEKNEEAAECLYNFVVEERFPKKFEKGLHKQSYTLYPLDDFDSLKTEREKQFFMLWTVQMYGRTLGGQNARQQKAFLENSDQAALILIDMEFSRNLLFVGMFTLEKRLPAGITLQSLSGLQLMFFLLTRDEYLGLGELERDQLHAFLERYFKYMWKDRYPAKKLSDEESRQFKEIVEFELCLRHVSLGSYTYTKFVSCFCASIQNGYPIPLLKKRFGLYLRTASILIKGAILVVYYPANEAVSDEKQCLLNILEGALEMVESDECVPPEKELACDQIERAIEECNKEEYSLEISALAVTPREVNPVAKKSAGFDIYS